MNNRLKSVLCSNSLDYLLVTDSLNMYYLTGYQGRLGFCLISRLGKVYLCVPKHLKTQALRSDLNNYEYEVITYSTTAALFNDTNIISKGSILGFENNLPFYLFNLLKNNSHIQLKNVSALIESLRNIKSSQEQEYLIQASKIALNSLDSALHNLTTEYTEIQLEAELMSEIIKNGGDGFPFRFEVSSGNKTDLLHTRPSNKKIKNNQILLIDFGCIYKGYNVDIARTYSVGNPPKEADLLYELLYNLQQKIISKIKPNICIQDITSFANDLFKSLKIEDKIFHDIGHGVGLSVHESPYLSPNSTETLQTGNVLNIELGLHHPVFGGFRLEDMILINKHGNEPITRSNRKLLNILRR